MSVIDKYTIYLSTTDIEIAEKIANNLKIEGDEVEDIKIFAEYSTIIVRTKEFTGSTLMVVYELSKREASRYGVRATVAPFGPMDEVAQEFISSNLERKKTFEEFAKYKQDARREVQEVKDKIIAEYGEEIFETDDPKMINMLLGKFMEVFKNIDSSSKPENSDNK